MNPRLFLFAAAACLAALSAQAEPVFAVRNEAALSRTTALPLLGQAQVLDAGESAYGLQLDWTNEYVNKRSATETLLFDGETQHISFGLRRGLAPGVEVGITVPVVLTNGGVLDSVIEGWHSAFGLANGGREFRPRDQYRYLYARNGLTRLDVNGGHNGFGDIELGVGIKVRDDFAIRALAKLPSGDEAHLTGGNAGGAFWFDFDPFADSARWFGFFSGGGSYNAQSRVLGDQQQQLVGFGGVGAGFRVIRPLALVAQFYGHSPLYKGSGIDALKRPGGQLTFGGRIELNPHLRLDLGVEEDVILNSSPDFSIHIGLGYR